MTNDHFISKKANLVLNQYLCPFFSVSHTVGEGLKWIRAGWGGGGGDYNRSIKDFLNTGHMMVYLTLQHVPHSFIINGDESVYIQDKHTSKPKH